MTQEELFKKLVAHCKEYGFIFPSSEIYDGLSAVYDYGQMGVELKNNIKRYWWDSMTKLHDNIVGIDAAIFMHPRVWEASVYSIGIPATLNLALPSLLISALNAILAAYSEVYILVLGIYYKLQTFIYLPANGIVQGMRPLIGYNYGAGEHKRVSQIYQIVLCMSGIIMVFGTVICLLIPGQLMGLFTHTEATIQAGETALRIIGAGFIASAVSVTSSGALEGLGKGTPSLLISLCRYVVVILPAAFWLSRLFDAVGVWHAFWVTEVIAAVISLIIYRKAIAKPVTAVRKD